MHLHYPNIYQFKQIKSLRAGRELVGDPSIEKLKWIKHRYDTVSFEKWMEPGIGELLSMKWCRLWIPFIVVERFVRTRTGKFLTKLYQKKKAKNS